MWEAIEADLLERHYTLDDIPGVVSWRAVDNLIATAGPGTAIYRLNNGPRADWSWDTWLLADVRDLLRWLQWAQSSGPKDGVPPPKPGYRPVEQEDPNSQHWGGPESSMSMDEMDVWVREMFFNPPGEET